MATADPGVRRRGRGSSAGIDRDRIVAAAQGMDPATITMQAVADRLGVDRKALHHHVSDREGLLRLVAATSFETSFAEVDLPLDGTWQELGAAYAGRVRAGMLATGALYDYVRFDPNPEQAAFAAVEALLTGLLRARFTEETAGRVLVLLTQTAVISARDELIEQTQQGHPQKPELQRALEESPQGAYTALRHLSQEPSIYDDEQFAFAVRVLIRGIELEHQAPAEV